MKKYTGFAEPILLHAGIEVVEACPRWNTPWVNYNPLLPQLQPYLTRGKNSL